MKTLFDLYKESKVNRFRFLEKKKRDFIECTSGRKQKNLIAELIRLEPSHLAEGWILDQVIKMLKDQQENIDYLQAAFISKGKRAALTEAQRDNLARASFLSHNINQRAEGKNTSKKKAIIGHIFDLPESESSKLPEEPVEAIEQRLKRYRKALDKRSLPFPYYGLDCVEVDVGTKKQRVEFYLFDKPITYEGHALFGNTTISIPVRKNSTMFIPFESSDK